MPTLKSAMSEAVEKTAAGEQATSAQGTEGMNDWINSLKTWDKAFRDRFFGGKTYSEFFAGIRDTLTNKWRDVRSKYASGLTDSDVKAASRGDLEGEKSLTVDVEEFKSTGKADDSKSDFFSSIKSALVSKGLYFDTEEGKSKGESWMSKLSSTESKLTNFIQNDSKNLVADEPYKAVLARYKQAVMGLFGGDESAVTSPSVSAEASDDLQKL